MFGDQHLESLGGAQVSMRLQKRYLEKAGHTVTVVAPKMHGRRGRGAAADPHFVDLPSVPITLDREYSLTGPGRRTDRWLDRAMASRPPVDLVHVQADFWGAYIGHRFAARHALPVVHTMHNRVDVGIEAVAPAPGLVLRAISAWQRRALSDSTPGADGWTYLRRFAQRSAAVTAPSSHFAHRLEQHGVMPNGGGGVDVVWNGIDDEVLDRVRAERVGRGDGPPRFVWLGRMSPEKRVLPFLHALAESHVDARVQIIGGGGQLAAARRLVRAHGLDDAVDFAGRIPYAEVLRRIGAADAVVQTSIGFETQGMTVFEAATLGTPSIVSDPDIAGELEAGYWQVADASTGALAAALRRATDDIAASRAPQPSAAVAERFRQSSRTEAMLEIYRRVIG